MSAKLEAQQQRPVVDCEGGVRLLVLVAEGEQTCLECFETLGPGDDYCPRCSDGGKVNPGFRVIPTTSYLRRGEYRIV